MSSVASTILDHVASSLEKVAGDRISVTRRQGTVIVTPSVPNSFAVSIYDEGDEVMISAQRWHTHYDDPDQALFCVIWLLSPFYRIVEEFKGGLFVATWLEAYEATGWEGSDPVYFLNPEHAPDWKAAPDEVYTRRLIQQNVLMPGVPYSETVPGAVLDENGLPQDSVIGVSTVEDKQSLGVTLF